MRPGVVLAASWADPDPTLSSALAPSCIWVTPSGLSSGPGEIGGGHGVLGADGAEQGWPGWGLPRLCSEAPLQSATCVHVYICICDVFFEFVLCFCGGAPEMFQASWGRAWPAPRPGDTRHSS